VSSSTCRRLLHAVRYAFVHAFSVLGCFQGYGAMNTARGNPNALLRSTLHDAWLQGRHDD
jgi:hypothetical protein